MKKIILLATFLLGIFPVIENEGIKLKSLSSAVAEEYTDETPEGEDDETSQEKSMGEILSDFFGLSSNIIGAHETSDGHVVFDLENGAIFDPSYGQLDEVTITQDQQDEMFESFQDPDMLWAFPPPEVDEYEELLAWWQLEPPAQCTDCPNPPEACDQIKQASGAAASSLYDDYMAQHVASGIHTMNWAPPMAPQNEQHFYVRNINGVPTPRSIEELGPSGGTPTDAFTDNTKAEFHNHPHTGIPAPSARDLHTALGHADQTGAYTDSYVYAADGTLYALHVENRTKAQAFKITHGNFVDANNGFSGGTTIGQTFKEVEKSFSDNGSNANEAYERALA